MNDEIKEILNRLEKIGYYASVPKELAYITTNITPQECKTILDYITNLQQENERLKQNQLKVLNRIRDFINTSKCEIIEGSYCNDMHSQYWKMFIQFAEELKKKIKGIDTKDYVYIPKWREQELLSQEEQLEDYKSRIEKAVEYGNCCTNKDLDLETLDEPYKTTFKTAYEIHNNYSDILNGRSDE